MSRKVRQTRSFRGSKSRNKVSVGEPAEGSLTKLARRTRVRESVATLARTKQKIRSRPGGDVKLASSVAIGSARRRAPARWDATPRGFVFWFRLAVSGCRYVGSKFRSHSGERPARVPVPTSTSGKATHRQVQRVAEATAPVLRLPVTVSIGKPCCETNVRR